MKKLFLIEVGTRTGNCWILHRAKTMKGINNQLEYTKTWDGERLFYVVESDTGVHAKWSVRGRDDIKFSQCFGNIMQEIRRESGLKL